MILSAILISCLLVTNCFAAVTKEHHKRSAQRKQKPRVTQIQVVNTNVEETDVVLTPEDFAGAATLQEVDLASIGVQVHPDPFTKAGKFEGDIHGNFTGRSIHKYINDSNSFARAAIKDAWRRWPNGEIPYVLSSQYGSYSKQVIAKAFEEYRKKTCIRFIPREETKHQDYIYINPDDGCYSLVGRTGGRQPVSLDSGCIQVGTIIHELMHSTGFFHEQSRADRDDYIEIVTTNIQSDAQDQFEKYSLRTITHLDLPYDYGSIMHYGPYAFSRNGLKTIKALKTGGEKMGQRDGFSSLDLQKLNKLYQCDATDDGDDGDIAPENVVPRPAPTQRPGPQPVTVRPSITTVTKCENSKWQCFFWSKLGYCRSYRDYMRQYCPKDCDLCDEITGTNQNRAATLAPPSSPSCRDSNDHCSQWSNSGYCDRDGFEDFMRQQCPQSCGTCTSGGSGSSNNIPPEQDSGAVATGDCQDDPTFRSKCKTYAFWGFCTGTNEDFMRRKCKKSCNFC